MTIATQIRDLTASELDAVSGGFYGADFNVWGGDWGFKNDIPGKPPGVPSKPPEGEKKDDHKILDCPKGERLIMVRDPKNPNIGYAYCIAAKN